MICFKKISIISYVPIAYSKVETIYFIFTFYMSETVFKSAGLGQLLLLLTFVVSYRISKLILTLILKVYSHWNEMSSYIFVSFRELVEKNTTANCRGRGQPLAVDVFSSDNSRKDTKKYEKIRKNTKRYEKIRQQPFSVNGPLHG